MGSQFKTEPLISCLVNSELLISWGFFPQVGLGLVKGSICQVEQFFDSLNGKANDGG